MSDTELAVKKVVSSKVNNKITPPKMYKVVYINDDITSMSFVVETLCAFFDYTDGDAQAMAMKINDEGSATVAVLPYEIAEQKGIEVTMLSRQNGFPLSIRLEPEA